MDSINQFFINIGNINRRWIYLIVGLSVIIPLISPINIPIQTSSHSQTVYDTLNSLDNGSKILLSFKFCIKLKLIICFKKFNLF